MLPKYIPFLPFSAMSASATSPSDGSATVFPPAVFVHMDMPEESRLKCVEFTLEALAKHKVEKDQAMHVKKALEEWNGALWVVVIGVAYGASLAHENSALCMFRIGKVHVLCFQGYDEGALMNTKKSAAPSAQKAVTTDDDPATAVAAVEESKGAE